MNSKEKDKFRKQCAGMSLKELKNYQMFLYGGWYNSHKREEYVYLESAEMKKHQEQIQILDQLIALEKLIS